MPLGPSRLGQMRCWNLRWKVVWRLVDLGLFVLAARWFAAVPFPRAWPAPVVAAFRPCGPALSSESWRYAGSLYCYQPCLCVSILRVWYVQDLEGLVDALLGSCDGVHEG